MSLSKLEMEFCRWLVEDDPPREEWELELLRMVNARVKDSLIFGGDGSEPPGGTVSLV